MIQLSLFPNHSQKKSATAQTANGSHIYTIRFEADLRADFTIYCETESQWRKAIDTFGINDVKDTRSPID